LTQNHPYNSFFLFPFYWNKWFSHLFYFFFCDFVVLVRLCFVLRLCVTLFVFSIFFKYLFIQILILASIQSMTLASSTLQIRKHGYSGYLNIVICVNFCILSFYTINMNVMSLFAYSSFLFLANLHCIDVFYQFEWINIIYFQKTNIHF